MSFVVICMLTPNYKFVHLLLRVYPDSHHCSSRLVKDKKVKKCIRHDIYHKISFNGQMLAEKTNPLAVSFEKLVRDCLRYKNERSFGQSMKLVWFIKNVKVEM